VDHHRDHGSGGTSRGKQEVIEKLLRSPRARLAVRSNASRSSSSPKVRYHHAGARQATARSGKSYNNAYCIVSGVAEFNSRALDHCAYWNLVELDFSRPGNRATIP